MVTKPYRAENHCHLAIEYYINKVELIYLINILQNKKKYLLKQYYGVNMTPTTVKCKIFTENQKWK